MILQQLYKDAPRILAALTDEPTTPMYDNVPVQWQVELTADGRFIGVVNRGEKGGARHLIPYNYTRAVDTTPNLLVDTADYALGVKDKNAVKKHAAFRELLERCAAETGDPAVKTVAAFLASGGVPENELSADLEGKQRVTFLVNGKWPTDSPAVKQWWDDETRAKCKGVTKPTGICAITGDVGPVERILPGSVRVGGESAPLISVNEAAGNSYGFAQALNGAVSRDAAERFTKALSALMRGEKTHVTLADTTYVFWTQDGEDKYTYDGLTDPNAAFVEKLFDSAQNPSQTPTAKAPTGFYGLALTGNKTRVVFRDWLQTTVPDAHASLRRWFQAMKIVDYDGATFKYFPVYKLAACLYQKDRKILKSDAPGLIRAALRGDALPGEMLGRAVARCRIEHRVTPARAAFLKLARTITHEEDAKRMTKWDETRTDPAYRCGGLLALLESIQYQAQGQINSTLIDRFFSAAAVTPERIFTMLVRKAEAAHLPKIRRTKGWGAYNRLKDDIGKLAPDPFPERHTLEQQADFLLGYYHKRADDRAKIQAAIAAKLDKATQGDK